jgi:thiol-disulfide isomerase/thioredoxin
MPARLSPLAKLLLLLVLAGCSKSPAPQPAAEATAESSSTAASPDAASDVKLDILSFDQIQERIASKRGQVVVVDAWSTSCPPCMKDFHNLVELHKQYQPNDVACVSLSFDYEGVGKPEEASGTVLTFLKQQGATFDNLMSNEESDVLYRKFKLNAVPAVFVYDRAGQLRERFESEGAYDKVRALVAELVKEPAGPAPSSTAPVDTTPSSVIPAAGG